MFVAAFSCCGLYCSRTCTTVTDMIRKVGRKMKNEGERLIRKRKKKKEKLRIRPLTLHKEAKNIDSS